MTTLNSPTGAVLEVTPWGPGLGALARLREAVATLPLFERLAPDARPHVVSLGFEEDAKGGWLQEPAIFSADLQSPGTHQTLALSGPIDRPEIAQLAPQVGTVAVPSTVEMERALSAVAAHEAFAPAVTAKTSTLHPSMPGAVHVLAPDGSVRRAVAVDVHDHVGPGEIRHRLALVDLVDQAVIVQPVDASGGCGSPDDGNNGDHSTDGMVQVTVTQNGEQLWHFVVVRPALTGPGTGSGLSIRFVSYKGREFLYRGDTPIVNVRYDAPNAFGALSYRDWLTEESAFKASGTDVIPGYRLCPSPPTTIFDPDGAGNTRAGGNFNGVSFHFEDSTVVVTSMMQAGWYRYRVQWRFQPDGTVQPTFSFSAVHNPATCDPHTHHAYWRFDFDIEGAAHNRIEAGWFPIFLEAGTLVADAQPAVATSAAAEALRPHSPLPSWHWTPAATETRWQRSPFQIQAWRAVNTQTGRGYVVHPGTDGFPDAFGVGDVWALQYHPNEDRDAGGAGDEAHIDPYVNGESIADTDIVLWYATHARHDEAADQAAHEHGHIVGPTLSPFNW